METSMSQSTSSNEKLEHDFNELNNNKAMEEMDTTSIMNSTTVENVASELQLLEDDGNDDGIENRSSSMLMAQIKFALGRCICQI